MVEFLEQKSKVKGMTLRKSLYPPLKGTAACKTDWINRLQSVNAFRESLLQNGTKNALT